MGITVTAGVIVWEILTFWIFSMLFFFLIDLYAKRKIGNANRLGYKILRAPRFFSILFVSAYTIAIVLWSQYGLEVSRNTLTYMGVPYFMAWSFFLVNVLRRVKAETKGRPWTK